MKAKSVRRALAVTATLCVSIAALAVRADDARHVRGDHPAVIVKRLQNAAGYDYASQFYPHPAWLYLEARQRNEETPARAATTGTAAPLAPAFAAAQPSPSTAPPAPVLR